MTAPCNNNFLYAVDFILILAFSKVNGMHTYAFFILNKNKFKRWCYANSHDEYQLIYLVLPFLGLLIDDPKVAMVAESYPIKVEEIKLLNAGFIGEFVANIESEIPEDIQPLKNLVISEFNIYNEKISNFAV